MNLIPDVKMTPMEAIRLWDNLTPAQQFQFREMMDKLFKGELMLKHVNVDDNEKIQNIVLEPKEKPSVSDKPFYKHFL